VINNQVEAVKMSGSNYIKEAICSSLIIVFTAFCLNAQKLPVLITGSFRQLPLKSFISEIEQKYPVRFFFDEKNIDNIPVTGIFNEIPLKECLELIFEKKQVNFYISNNNQVVIYPGYLLSGLFPGSDLNEEEKK